MIGNPTARITPTWSIRAANLSRMIAALDRREASSPGSVRRDRSSATVPATSAGTSASTISAWPTASHSNAAAANSANSLVESGRPANQPSWFSWKIQKNARSSAPYTARAWKVGHRRADMRASALNMGKSIILAPTVIESQPSLQDHPLHVSPSCRAGCPRQRGFTNDQ